MIKFFSIFLSLLFYSFEVFSAYSCSQADATQNQCEDLIKLNSAAALGQCLPSELPTDIPALLARNNVTIYTGNIPNDRGGNSLAATNLQTFTDLTDHRVVAVSRVLSAYENIGNRSFDALRRGSNIDIVFGRNAANNSRRNGSQIQLAGGNQNMTGMLGQSQFNGQDNIGLIAHEIAHYIGGAPCGSQFESQGNTYYQAYQNYTDGARCGITSYARDHSRRNNGAVTEEFAEVVAAYLTMPQIFLNSDSEGCRKAFRFMRQMFGETDQLNLNMSSNAMCTARRNSYNPNGNGVELQDRQPNMPNRVNLRSTQPALSSPENVAPSTNSGETVE